jgi:hypothetical protein
MPTKALRDQTSFEELSVKRMNPLFALCAAFAVLASQACNSSSPDGASASDMQSVSSKQGVANASTAVTATKPAGTLQITMSPAALPGTAFGVDVAFRSSTGALLDVTDVVTLSLATTPVTGATLGGTRSRAAVHGIASFPDLVLATVGTGYVLGASSSQVAVTTTAVKSPALKVAFSEDDQLTVGAASNTTATAAQAISPNVPIFGTLGAAQVHYYKFTGKAAQLVAVSSYANRLDLNNWDTSLRIRLLAADGLTEIARSGAIDGDAPGVDTGFKMLQLPVAGVYYLACDQDQSGFASGKFAVLLTLPATPPGTVQTETEPAGTTGQNDTAATAQALVPGVMFGHYDNPSTNLSAPDYYKITLTAMSRVQFELTAARNGAANGGALWDGQLSLQDSAGNVLAQSDNIYYLDPAIDYVVTTLGTYYLRVTRSEYAANTGSAPYVLTYAATPQTSTMSSVTGSNTAATAVAINAATYYGGSFAAAGTQYLSFTGTAGDVIRFLVADKSQLQGATVPATPATDINTVTSAGLTTGTLTSPAVSATTTSAAPTGTTSVAATTVAAVNTTGIEAVILGGDGVTPIPIASSASTPSETRLNTKQSILQATGKYYVKVTSVAAGKFGFRLDTVASTAREVVPNNTAATGTVVPAAGWVSGVISAGADKDHFKVHAEAGQLVSLSLLGAAGAGMGTSLADWGSALVGVVEVKDAAGNLIATSSADRNGLPNFAESTARTDSMIETSFRASTGADYDVAVSDADGQGGAAYFYALHVWKNQ